MEVLDEISRLNNEIVNSEGAAKRTSSCTWRRRRKKGHHRQHRVTRWWSPTDCITSMNGLAQHLTGWPMEEALGRDGTRVVRFIDAEGRDLVEGLARPGGAQPPRLLDAWLVSRNGVRRAVDR